jgi:hypothetical protein
MEWLSFASNVIGVLGGVFAFFAWIQASRLRKDAQRELLRQNAQVKIILEHGDNRYELPVPIRRAELSRAELLGRLGMIPVRKKVTNDEEQKRFSIEHLNSAEFFVRLDEIILSSGNETLVIPCTTDEFEQFALTQVPE